jgi:hypothetical protein
VRARRAGRRGSAHYTDLSVVAGTTYYYVVSAINTVGTSSSEGLDSAPASATPPNDYNAWINNPAQGLTVGENDGPLMDPDEDGLVNLLEFILSSPPNNSNSTAIPTIAKEETQWVFAYPRNDASIPPATIQVVQYSSNLSDWSDITIPATSSGNVTVTPGSPSDQIRVFIPNTGEKVFARLKATP